MAKYFWEIPKHHLIRIHKTFLLTSNALGMQWVDESLLFQINFQNSTVRNSHVSFIFYSSYPSICDLSCCKNMVHNIELTQVKFYSYKSFIIFPFVSNFLLSFFYIIQSFFLLFVLISWEYGVICVSSNTGKQQKKVNCVNVDFKDDFITFLLLYFVRCLFAYLLLLLLL